MVFEGTISTMTETITYKSIGIVENEIDELLRPERIQMVESRLVLNPELSAGLQGLEPGYRIAVIFHFHRSEGYQLVQHPRGDRSRSPRGVFALRSPNRPNPIGVTVVEIVAIEGNVLHVRDLDAVNGTPILDLKPVRDCTVS